MTARIVEVNGTQSRIQAVGFGLTAHDGHALAGSVRAIKPSTRQQRDPATQEPNQK